MRFAIQGKVYNAVDITRLTMKDMLLFEQQTAEFGRRLSWDDVVRWHDEIDELDEAGRADHPEMLWLTAVSIWAARRAAGDPVTFEQAIDIPAADIKTLPELEGHKKPAPKARAPKAPKAGGAVAKNAADASG